MADNKKISLVWADNTGEYHRKPSSFRNFISSKQTPGEPFFPPEAGRYHLYVSYACPWGKYFPCDTLKLAHRTMLVRALKGLEDVIGVTSVHYFLDENGWRFGEPNEDPGCDPEPIYGAKFLKELYVKANPDYSGRFTVPVLWDRKTGTIVNNESSEIIRMLNSEFNSIAKNPTLDLYPSDLQGEIDQINGWVYDDINNGVYKAGFATKQDVYEKHCRSLFAALDRVESHLSGKEYLVGGKLTEADIRLFTTIVRFDPVYHGHFKCNMKSIEHGYPNILKWLRKVFQQDRGAIEPTIRMDHIKKHYYMSHVRINPNQVVPLHDGPDLTVEV